jgi:hypothetical protein
VSVVEWIPTDSGFEVLQGGSFSLVVSGTPARNARVDAVASRFTARHAAGRRLDILVVSAENGERRVEARRIESESPWVRKLDGRLRLTITDCSDVGSWCELRVAKPKPGGWSSLFGATLEGLDSAAGVSVEREPRRAGGCVGSREDLLGESGPRRAAVCAVFETANERVPVTRVPSDARSPAVETMTTNKPGPTTERSAVRPDRRFGDSP